MRRFSVALALLSFFFAASASAHIAVDFVREVIEAHHGELSACYARSLAASAPRTEPVHAHLVIDIAADGHVTGAHFAPGTSDPDFDACIVASVRTWVFRPTGHGDIHIHYPLVFQSP